MPGQSSSGGGESADIINKGIDKMYKIYEKLNSAPEKATLDGDFKELLEAVKRSEKEKRLASQFITRFVEFFPLLYDDAINALLDLCEDDDVAIRKQACKDLVTVCKKVSTFVPKIADVFTQLMVTDDVTELKALEGCLMSLFNIDAQAAVVGVFSQIHNGENIVRERCLKFLTAKLKDLCPGTGAVELEFERGLIKEARKCAPELGGEEFKQLHALLIKTKTMNTVTGQQMMVDLISDVLEMDKPFDASEADHFQKLLVLSKSAVQTFTNQISSSPYLVYFCTKVLPNLNEVTKQEKGEALKLEALRIMADIAAHAKSLDSTEAEKCLDPVFKNLIEIMPLPPAEDELNPKFEFSIIETLLFTLHKLGSFHSEFLTQDPERLKDFRIRLQYLARGTQAYMKKLREDLQGKKGLELKNEENRAKIQGLKLTSNISAVIKDLFHTPPSYKSNIGLSWRPIPRNPNAPLKRSSTDAALNVNNSNNNPKQPRGVLYQPPSGKFSGRGGNYSSPPRRGGRGGYGGGMRRGGYRGGRGRY